MDEKKLSEIEAREKAATKGPWSVRANEYDDWGCIRAPPNEMGQKWPVANARAGRHVSEDEYNQHRGAGSDPYGHNAEFIAHAREDVPALAAEVRALRALLADRQWSSTDESGNAMCGECRRHPISGHARDCALGRALT